MLVIRKAQLAALARSLRDRFEKRLEQRISARWPGRWTDAELEAFVERGVQAAEAHGIREADSVATVVVLRADFGEAFELSPDDDDALAILADASLPGQVKAQLLEECLTLRTAGRRIELVTRG